MTRLLALIGAVALSSLTISAQAADPAAGTWELNVAKSKFVPAAMAPRSQTRVIEVKGRQETGRHTGVDARGNPTLVEYTVTADGKKYPYKGSPDWDSLAVTRVDAYTTQFTQSGPGKATINGTRVVSKDGKTLTVSGKGTTANGEPVFLTMVFEKR